MSVSEWQLIETAPKDGMPIIVYSPENGVFTAEYTESLCDCCYPEERHGEEAWFASTGEDLTDDMPTHWMPLPTPPKGETD